MEGRRRFEGRLLAARRSSRAGRARLRAVGAQPRAFVAARVARRLGAHVRRGRLDRNASDAGEDARVDLQLHGEWGRRLGQALSPRALLRARAERVEALWALVLAVRVVPAKGAPRARLPDRLRPLRLRRLDDAALRAAARLDLQVLQSLALDALAELEDVPAANAALARRPCLLLFGLFALALEAQLTPAPLPLMLGPRLSRGALARGRLHR